MLALASPSEAKIVYTPANVRIVGNVQKLNLDLNNDGSTDFEFCVVNNSNTGYCPAQPGRKTSAWKNSPSPFSSDLWIFPAKAINAKANNQIWGHLTFNGDPTASALPAGVRVGPKGAIEFSPGQRLMATWGYAGFSTNYGGPWANAVDRYVGLKFIIKGKIHYGWARLTVHWHELRLSATLTGYAYETVPGKSIITGKRKGPDDQSKADHTSPAALHASPPKPATLGLLALGASGFVIWRREDHPSMFSSATNGA